MGANKSGVENAEETKSEKVLGQGDYTGSHDTKGGVPKDGRGRLGENQL